MRPSETKRISATIEATSQKMPSMSGSRLRFKIGKLLVPALAGFRGKALDDVMKLDLAELQPVLAPLLAQLDEKTHDALMLEILTHTYVVRTEDGKEPIRFDLGNAKAIDLAFDGDVDALWATAWFALGVNLKGVFAAGAGNAQPSPTP